MRVDECKEEEDEHVFAVAGEAQGGKLMVNIGGIPEEMIIDSGASENVISHAMWEQLKKQQLLSSEYQEEVQRSCMPMARLPLLKWLHGTFTTDLS